jgi:hypothetical protein
VEVGREEMQLKHNIDLQEHVLKAGQQNVNE